MVFYDNYVRMCNKVKKSPSAAAEEMGMKRSVVTAWKNGRSPRAATLQRIADYFGCSTSELLDEKECPLSEDRELAEYLSVLRERPEMKMLFHTFSGASKAEIEAIVLAWEARNNIKEE